MMSDPLMIALVVSIPPTIASIAALVSSIKNRRKLDNLHGDINSRLTELVEHAKAAAHALGHAEGMKAERDSQQK